MYARSACTIRFGSNPGGFKETETSGGWRTNHKRRRVGPVNWKSATVRAAGRSSRRSCWSTSLHETSLAEMRAFGPVANQPQCGRENVTDALVGRCRDRLIHEESAVGCDIVRGSNGSATAQRRLLKEHDRFFRNEFGALDPETHGHDGLTRAIE